MGKAYICEEKDENFATNPGHVLVKYYFVPDGFNGQTIKVGERHWVMAPLCIGQNKSRVSRNDTMSQMSQGISTNVFNEYGGDLHTGSDSCFFPGIKYNGNTCSADTECQVLACLFSYSDIRSQKVSTTDLR